MAAGTGGTHSMGSASGGHPQVELATHPRTRSTLHKALYCQGYRGYLLPTVACGSEAAPSPTERIERAARTHDLERVDVCALHLEASLGATFVAPLPL